MILVAAPALAQFSEVGTPLPGLYKCALEWGDYDNDGDLDVVVSGRDGTPAPLSPFTRLYRNDGGSLVDANAGLPDLEDSAVSWGDLDGDGDLDLLISGLDVTGTPITRLYRNDAGTFIDSNAGLIGLSRGALAWADYDSDGRLDFVITGADATNQPISRLYRNTGSGFADAGAGLTNVSQSAVAWGDHDSDGDPDLLLTGLATNNQPVTLLYGNIAGALFPSGSSFVGVYDGAVAWMDADSDGDLDFALTGRTPSGVAFVYFNQGGGNFGSLILSGPGLYQSSVSWADYDADGSPDLLLTGRDDGSQPHTQLYRKGGGQSYALQSLGLADITDGTAQWGDYDGDGRLDFLLAGLSGSTPVTRLYQNQSPTANSLPFPPSSLNSSQDGVTATFMWNPGADDETPAPGLGYNLRIGTTPNGNDVLCSLSDSLSGFRQVVRMGNVGAMTSWSIPVSALPANCFWTVQAIDASLAGSPWAPSQAFTVQTATSTALVSAPNPVQVGHLVTMTATVTPPTAAGNVAFKDGAGTLATVALSGGTATYSTSALTTGSHTLTAVYAGDLSHLGSTSPPVTQVVTTQQISSTALTSSPNPSNIGQLVTLTATVTPSSATGSVSFKDGGINIGGSVSLSGGVATRTTTTLTGGTHTLTAVYAGNGGTLGSTSPAVTHIVTQPTTTVVTASPNPSVVGQSVTITATVTPASATGNVTFTDNNVSIGTGSLSGGVATLLTSSLAFGNHPLRAVYAGDIGYAGSTSSPHNQNVLNATSTALVSSPNPALTNELVTITATVTPPGATGSVTIKDGATTIGAGPLSGGVFTLGRNFNTAGTHPLTAIYGGNSQYGSSTSPVVSQAVQGTTTTTLESTPNPSTVGQSVILTASVVPLGATGVVTFMDGATVLGTSAVTSGEASINTSALALGVHTLSAAYGGDSNYLPGTSQSVSHQVTVFMDIAAGLPEIGHSAVAWGDYDSDGDLDFVLTGYSDSLGAMCRIYRNNGTPDPTFTDIAAGLPGLYYGAVAWGDYDNDGDLDLILTGREIETPVSRIYRNSGGSAPTFTDVGAGLPGIYNGAVAWGDYDDDGDLDLLLVGGNGPDLLARVYRNSGGANPVFTDSGAALPAVGQATAAWGDYDNDGDLDILLAGFGPNTWIFRNSGGVNPTFTDIGAGLPSVSYDPCVAWGDYDNDGDLDVLLTGESGVGPISRIYRNSGGPNPTFADISAGLPGLEDSSVAWGDFDNDGDLDLLLTGSTTNYPPSPASRIYQNNGGPNPSFSDITNTVAPGLSEVAYSAVAWADYDNDGDLDFLLTGWTGATGISRVYRNSGGYSPNTVPTAPTALTASLAGNQVTLSWQASTDNQTPAAGLSYNVRVGTTPGGSEVTAAMASTADGYRRVVGHGNAQKRTSWTFSLPGGGGFFWSVQAIDNAWAGSPFAAERMFGPFSDVTAGLTGVHNSAAAWGDYDNDGDLDLALTGTAGPLTPTARLYRNNAGANPTFTEIPAGLPGVQLGAVAWGDYDNDGDLDLLLSGLGPGPSTRLYRNSGGANPAFASVAVGLPGVYYSSVAWGDYDNDGDLDILLAGMDNTSTRISRVYRNSGGVNPTFADIGAGLPGTGFASVAWGDYDNDGDLDILLTGYNATLLPISRIYRNNGGTNPTFTDIAAGLPGIDFNSAAWGDYDNDGDLDLVLSGSDPTFVRTCRIYRNSGGSNPTFADIAAGLPGVRYSSVAWGDYDNDGNLDLLLTGETGPTPIARIYRNSGGANPTFSDIGAGVTGVYASSATWADYDNDSDLDLLTVGDTGAGDIARIYRNGAAAPNTPPAAPTGLFSSLNGNQLTLTWSPSSDAQTPAAGLSYNLRVGTTPGGIQIVAAMADVVSGYRRVVGLGNAQKRTSWTLTVPAPGSGVYYWSVQGVDAASAGGPWAADNVSAVEEAPALPTVAALRTVMPNPFHAVTRVEFDQPRDGRLELRIFDVRGRLVRTLNDGIGAAGRHEAIWDGTDNRGQRLGAGVYLVRMETQGFRQTRRVVLLP